jgi:hypothetical protein
MDELEFGKELRAVSSNLRQMVRARCAAFDEQQINGGVVVCVDDSTYGVICLTMTMTMTQKHGRVFVLKCTSKPCHTTLERLTSVLVFNSTEIDTKLSLSAPSNWQAIVRLVVGNKHTRVCPMVTCSNLFLNIYDGESVCPSCFIYLSEAGRSSTECSVCLNEECFAGMVHCDVCKSGDVCVTCFGKLRDKRCPVCRAPGLERKRAVMHY